MDGAGQDWGALGAAASEDAGLASIAAGGALLLWNRETGRPGFADAGARALLGVQALEQDMPAPARQRLDLLADGLAPREGVRLERLRLTGRLSVGLVTCACKLLTSEGGQAVLAVAIPAGEMRRLGIAVAPAPTPAAAMAASQPETISEPEPAAVAPAEPPPRPRRAMVRFLWNSDAAGRLTSVSPDVAELTGSEAAALVGQSWSDLIGREILDRDGGLAERLAGSATWSGHRVLWRSETPAEGVRVELSGAPQFDAARAFAGFRGFGLARLTEREPFPEQETPPEHESFSEPELLPEPEALPEPELRSEPEVLPQDGWLPEAQSSAADEACDKVEATDAAGSETEVPAVAEAARDVLIADETAASLAQPEPDGRSEPEDRLLDREIATPEEPLAATPASGRTGEDDAAATAPEPIRPSPAAETPPAGGNVYPLRNGHLTSVRPVLEPSKLNLSSAERSAFREIAKALGARIAGEDEIGPRLPPVAPLRLKETEARDAAAEIDRTSIPHHGPLGSDAPAEPGAGETPPPETAPAALAEIAAGAASEATSPDVGEPVVVDVQRQRLPNSHADVLDRLPIAVLVNRGDTALYANRTLLDLLDYADLDDLAAGGSVSRLIKEASRIDGGAMILIDRLGHLVSVDAMLSSVAWQGEPATLMAFRHPGGGGEVRVLSPEEAEEAELAAEFEAEEAESSARVEALRLDVDAREDRIAELVAVLDTATDGVVTVDDRGRILSLNKTAEALFGYDQREVTGELFTLLFGAESHAPALDYLEGLKGGGVASVMNDGREIVGRVRQGGRIPLFMTMGRITEGPERRFCAVLRDITAWKKTEGELVEARRAAEKASAQKSDVLAKISHEIRTPLNAIIGFAEVMAEERFGPIANERYKEYLRDIHQSGGYVISLVNDLLDLAKIEAGKLDLDFVSVNLNEIALSTVALLQPEANRGRVVLRSGLSPKLPPVVADERSIRQIVINLLSNAVKFTDAGGQVIVSTALGDQGEAVLRVRDTGIGMDDGEIALALEPFRQVPTTRRKGGTGLGLPLTKALVEANRAAMAITSVKKEGTLVEITFPPQRVLAG